MAHLAKVTGRSCCTTFSLASKCYFVSIFSRVFVYAISLLFFPVARGSALNIKPRGEACCSSIASALSQSIGETRCKRRIRHSGCLLCPQCSLSDGSVGDLPRTHAFCLHARSPDRCDIVRLKSDQKRFTHFQTWSQ